MAWVVVECGGVWVINAILGAFVHIFDLFTLCDFVVIMGLCVGFLRLYFLRMICCNRECVVYGWCGLLCTHILIISDG